MPAQGINNSSPLYPMFPSVGFFIIHPTIQTWEKIFSKVSEANITKPIVSEFTQWFEDYITSDVIVVGAAPVQKNFHRPQKARLFN